MSSAKPLKERLEELQCHFTWRFDEHGPLDTLHLLQKLGLEIIHTPYRIHSTLFALRAFLCQREGRHEDALGDLGKAEKYVSEGHAPNPTQSKLLIYGNYAWIYYQLDKYDKAEEYLGKINGICNPVSSSHPAALNLDMNEAKGWSYLAIGHRNGEEAESCFREALAKDPENREFKAGLALALYSKTKRYDPDHYHNLVEEAKTNLWQLVRELPDNYDLKSCLAILLKESDQRQAKKFAKEAVWNSRDPNVLRNAANVYLPRDQKKYCEILKQAISFGSGYHLLYRDLGCSYLKQLQQATIRDEWLITEAIKAFKVAIALDPICMWSQTGLAEVYMINKQHKLAIEKYKSLEAALTSLSPQTQQMFYLSYGNFLLYGKRVREEAEETFREGFEIPSETKERDLCKKQLEKIAEFYNKSGRRAEAMDINNLIQARSDARLGETCRCKDRK